MQLDLFTHCADVGLRNAVIAALCARDAGAMRDAIDRLRGDFPGDDDLDNFEYLFSEFSALEQPDRSAPALLQQVERIESRLRPSLTKIIGSEAARRWAEPLYGELARTARGQAFARNRANAHAAGLFLRAGELASARAAVAEIPSWRRIPEPLAWMTEIALCEAVPDEYWPLVAELAWIAPTQLATLLTDAFPSTAPTHLPRLYKEFFAAVETDGENDETVWFPAWLLVEHPDLLSFLRAAQPQDSRPARSAALLVDLLLGERRGGLAPATVNKRQQLRALAPAIFERYMARRRSTPDSR